MRHSFLHWQKISKNILEKVICYILAVSIGFVSKNLVNETLDR
jgi:hypothetical protein